MIFFLNRGLILELEVVKALKKYFSILGVPGYYRNCTVTVTNDHPFARMLLSEAPEKDAASLFPVVVVATESETIPSELASLEIGDADTVTIEPEDIEEGEDGKSAIERRYDMITPEIMRKIREEMDIREDKRIFGTSMFNHRRDFISIEIWAENPQLKNELYEIVRLFIVSFMREYLAELYKQFFPEIGDGESPLTIFDSTVRGQRSNNFNLDFGIELHGAQITFEADYIVEQTVIDTGLVDTNNLFLEVINHVRHYAETTRERIGPPDGENESGRALGDGSSGDSGDTGEAEPDNSPEITETSG